MTAIQGRVLLTGASGGIGQAIARALAARGASLVLTGRRADALASLADEVSGQALACDLSVRDQVSRLVAEVGDVEILVANAAHPASGVLTELDQERIDHMLEVNLRAPIALARALAPAMASRGRGHLVFISSLAGKAASSSSSIYSATKFGLRGFALGLREDLRPSGVGVSVVLPGFIRESGMFAEAEVELPRGVGTRTPEQVAQAVVRAIDRNRAEVDVAPLTLRVGASLAGLAPELAARMNRLMGGQRVASDLTAGQRHIN
ncbi:MAG TPA: SDR family NAD(P)-dependent oxidoreductase [Solirubrobacteraceae bacterium]|jgi:short-subunit dehydrogenase